MFVLGESIYNVLTSRAQGESVAPESETIYSKAAPIGHGLYDVPTQQSSVAISTTGLLNTLSEVEFSICS